MAKQRFSDMSGDARRQASEDVDRSMRGMPTMHGTDLSQFDNDADDQGQGKVNGTEASGYEQPGDGPFRCDNCKFFTMVGGNEGDDDAQGQCAEPDVVNDPQVRGNVQAGGCCSYFTTLNGNQEGAPMPGNGGPGGAGMQVPPTLGA